MEFSIRPAVESDATALAEISVHPGVVKNLSTMPTERPEDWAARLERYKYSFVAVVNDRVVGMVGLARGQLPRNAHGGILHLMVHTDFHGRGLGTALMEHTIEFSDNWLGLHRLELEVFASNPRAQALYARLGFEVEGRRREAILYQGRYGDVIMMSRLRPYPLLGANGLSS